MLGGFGNNAYLCSVKTIERYEDAATEKGGYFCAHQSGDKKDGHTAWGIG